jgi:hypothetical protein
VTTKQARKPRRPVAPPGVFDSPTPIDVDPEPIVPIIIYDPVPPDIIRKLKLKTPLTSSFLQVALFSTKHPVPYDAADTNPVRLIVPVVTIVNTNTGSAPITIERHFKIETHDAGTPAGSPFKWFFVNTLLCKAAACHFRIRHRAVAGTVAPPTAGQPNLDRQHFDQNRSDVSFAIPTAAGPTTVTYAWRRKLVPASETDGDPSGLDLLLQQTFL